MVDQLTETPVTVHIRPIARVAIDGSTTIYTSHQVHWSTSELNKLLSRIRRIYRTKKVFVKFEARISIKLTRDSDLFN